MKALITGSAGFYGKHLCTELEENGYEVIRCDLKAEDDIISMDIMDSDMVLDIISQHRPDVLVNMAGQANVGLSWKKPQLTVQLNTIGLINILEAVKTVNPKMRVIAIGSSDEYGNLKERGANVVEEMPVSPMTPYAISKQAQELFAQLYNKNFGMNVCMVRQFNLGGAGQAKGFMIADFASGIVDIERGQREYLSVGNLESARDFTHVKDACRAIRLIAEKGHTGEVYNICSGSTHTAQEVLDKLISMAKVQIEVRQDPARMRPSDTPVVCGNHDKLTSHTGWKPEMNLDEIIKDALGFWRIP
ncbi:GDPmannose 4,6-dehydratase [Ruminococcus flavefaciens]|uniref:GDPmannose 4,6-dehydratase n=1 Tax=Ruminococcus flavefaciens TaxID=1265 RepID=A0A1H6ICT4_RUMFL|nr:GDP-mannose 4,6-dehydratase [Ruminococcus flavefaciens]SEH46491.1 GDPmannose 4,6-dehydratase [Ruminococcus flavefaciens]